MKVPAAARAVLQRAAELWRRRALAGDAVRWIERESARREPRLGAAVFAVLFLLSFWQAGPWSLPGLPESEALRRLRASLWPGELLFQAGLLVVYSAVGAVLGTVWGIAWAWAARLTAGAIPIRPSRPVRVAVAVGGVLLLHGAFLISDMGRHPALYGEFFRDKPFPLPLFYRMASDGFWLPFLSKAAAALVLAAAAMEIFRRLFAWQRRLSRPARLEILVLAGAGLAFAAGVWSVRRWEAGTNAGPNFLVLVVDGLRSDSVEPRSDAGSSAPRLSELARRGRYFPRCAASLPAAAPSLMTFLTGRSPLTHGVRHAFPPAEDASSDARDLPSLLAARGYATAVLADSAGEFFFRFRPAFHEARAPDGRAAARLRQRALKAHAHILPYVTNPAGRFLFPSLRALPELSDPALLADEARGALARLRFKGKFFLAVCFSALHTQRGASSADREEFRRLYGAGVAAVDGAAGRLLAALKEFDLAHNTTVVLWSPFGEDLSESGPGHGAHLRGARVIGSPLVIYDPRRPAPFRSADVVRAEDVAPTLLDLAGVPPPAFMEGSSLARPESVPRPDAYAETDVWVSVAAGPEPAARMPYPPLADLLELDPRSGYLVMKAAAEDHVLTAKHRMIQRGNERLIYMPTRKGVRYELLDFGADPDGLRDFSGEPGRQARAAELKEALFQLLSRERGWRPQNGYWIPEAFLRE